MNEKVITSIAKTMLKSTVGPKGIAKTVAKTAISANPLGMALTLISYGATIYGICKKFNDLKSN